MTYDKTSLITLVIMGCGKRPNSLCLVGKQTIQTLLYTYPWVGTLNVEDYVGYLYFSHLHNVT